MEIFVEKRTLVGPECLADEEGVLVFSWCAGHQELVFSPGNWGWIPKKSGWFCPSCVEQFVAEGGATVYPVAQLRACPSARNYFSFVGWVETPDELVPLAGGRPGEVVESLFSATNDGVFVETREWLVSERPVEGILWLSVRCPSGPWMEDGLVCVPSERTGHNCGGSSSGVSYR